MFVYHFSWDLTFLGLLRVDVGGDPGWRLFAHFIAGTFLALVGVGLVLAHQGRFRLRPFLRRLAKVAAAALALSVVTWFLAGAIAAPQLFVYFGILHLIALSSVLALPFVWAPTPVTLFAAVFCIAAPHYLRSDFFDAPYWWWLGLSTWLRPTVDFVPVLPWMGVVLAGIPVGRAILRVDRSWAILAWRPQSPLARGVVVAGQWSLAIYLVHQPALFGIAYLLATVLR